MRCPDCNKFVSLDTDQEPELNVDVGEDGTINGDVRIANACADCGTELTEYTFDVNTTCEEANAHVQKAREEAETAETAGIDSWPEGTDKPTHELSLENEEAERVERQEGKGRGTRTFYGWTGRCTIVCACGEHWDVELDGDEVQASAMDSCC